MVIDPDWIKAFAHGVVSSFYQRPDVGRKFAEAVHRVILGAFGPLQADSDQPLLGVHDEVFAPISLRRESVDRSGIGRVEQLERLTSAGLGNDVLPSLAQDFAECDARLVDVAEGPALQFGHRLDELRRRTGFLRGLQGVVIDGASLVDPREPPAQAIIRLKWLARLDGFLDPGLRDNSLAFVHAAVEHHAAELGEVCRRQQELRHGQKAWTFRRESSRSP